MARLFTYGRLNQKATLPGLALPGSYTIAHGVQYGEAAFDADATNDVEFGEPVEITVSNDKGTGIKRVTSSITAATLAFVLRGVVGIRSIQAGTVEAPHKTLPVTVVKAAAPSGWAIAVPLAASQTPAAGGAVYIGKGSNGTVLGGVYATAQGSGGADSIDSGWKFVGAKYKPTAGAGECAWITKI